MTSEGQPNVAASADVSLREACATWLRIGCLSFGGPAAQIAVMHRLVVEEKRWVDERRFMNALNCCVLLPGPEAQQLATFLGWTLHGIRGGLAAGLLFILPGSLIMLLLGIMYTEYRGLPAIAALFFGLKCAVLPILADAVIRMSRRVLQSRPMIWAAVLSSLFTLFTRLPFPALVAFAGLAGWFGSRRQNMEATSSTTEALKTSPDWRAGGVWISSLKLLLPGLACWFAPLLAAWRLQGWDSVYVQIVLFFSRAAVVTFGGAYAVLSYVNQQAVEHYGWLDKSEMADGLGLAETTPGPLILVVQFVGHLAGWRHGEGLPAVVGGLIGAILATWVTFVPSFLWIFLSAPWVDRLPRIRGAALALQTISAAVVGVIFSLGLSLAGSTLFSGQQLVNAGPLLVRMPVWSSVQPAALAITAFGAILLWGLRAGMGAVLCGCVAAGLVLKLVL